MTCTTPAYLPVCFHLVAFLPERRGLRHLVVTLTSSNPAVAEVADVQLSAAEVLMRPQEGAGLDDMDGTAADEAAGDALHALCEEKKPLTVVQQEALGRAQSAEASAAKLRPYTHPEDYMGPAWHEYQ